MKRPFSNLLMDAWIDLQRAIRLMEEAARKLAIAVCWDSRKIATRFVNFMEI
jgi:hypothetical protein